MGRPPINGEAMTAAQRKARQRQLDREHNRPTPERIDAVIIDALRRECAAAVRAGEMPDVLRSLTEYSAVHFQPADRPKFYERLGFPMPDHMATVPGPGGVTVTKQESDKSRNGGRDGSRNEGRRRDSHES